MDWFPWYPRIFRAATRHLTTEQRCFYRDLIDEYMETREPLPDHDVALAGICRTDVKTWSENSTVIKKFFRKEGDQLFHDFCDLNLIEQDKVSKSRTKSAKNAALKRWENKKKPIMRDVCATECGTDALAMPGNATLQDTTLHNITEGKEPIPHKPPFLIPDWIQPGDWKDYSDMRQKIRKPMTDRAKKLAVATLEKLKAEGHDPKAVLQQSVFNSWQGLFAPKGNSNENPSRQPSYSERLKAAGDAAERTFRARRPDLFEDDEDEGQGALLQLEKPSDTIL